ncbi:uncharacterized protein GGS25DRAFT_527521 [Hypoxylon fragiforme]|uniref:uncharacterized protein n=1 Tax=Hypoxylon fragiforme TaxID=63214 RepID=UPI0020C5BDE3|nr:uncharacterized protein GGS25DRAFT_527521 [Hypoxylon fragiforme]KAI2614442.1 hypothetical protein GGS25DRAFT_527521 [Hypoxylon fragiforme]
MDGHCYSLCPSDHNYPLPGNFLEESVVIDNINVHDEDLLGLQQICPPSWMAGVQGVKDIHLFREFTSSSFTPYLTSRAKPSCRVDSLDLRTPESVLYAQQQQQHQQVVGHGTSPEDTWPGPSTSLPTPPMLPTDYTPSSYHMFSPQDALPDDHHSRLTNLPLPPPGVQAGSDTIRTSTRNSSSRTSSTSSASSTTTNQPNHSPATNNNNSNNHHHRSHSHSHSHHLPTTTSSSSSSTSTSPTTPTPNDSTSPSTTTTSTSTTTPTSTSTQCWDHGCNGRRFSTRGNLVRHQKEQAPPQQREVRKACCRHCGAFFTRTTARDKHVVNQSCGRIRRYSNGRVRPLFAAAAAAARYPAGT